jgi:drug/metabolite transporter (DMT)-like permease
MNKSNYNWLLYSVGAGLSWGIWGVIVKDISEDVSPYLNHCLFTIGMLMMFPLLIRKLKVSNINKKGFAWSIIAGILAVAGNVAVYKAFSNGGNAAVVIPVTNLYPLVTIVVALFAFKEKLNWVNGIGILLSVPAILLLSGESLLFKEPAAFFQSISLNTWLFYSFVAMLFWGLFSAAQKITTNHISAEWSYIGFIVSSVFISLLFLLFGWVETNVSGRNLWLGFVAGMLNGLGVLSSFAAYSAEGKASKVTTIAGALQPVFTIVLAVGLLREKISFMEVIGILIAIIGTAALSYEKKDVLFAITVKSKADE